jgi:lipopolysaccharide export system protein LptC
MAAGPGLYSRIVAFLKVGLPLVAVAMLAALFLISNDGRTGRELVFSPADLAALGDGMQVSAPVFSGVTEELDRFRFTAAEVTPDAAPPRIALIDMLAGRIDFSDGQSVELSAERGRLDLETQRMTLTGQVRVDSADGFSFAADQVDLDLAGGGLEATGSVEGLGPMGRIDAARLNVSGPQGDKGTRMFLFEDDVSLIYDPAKKPE